MATSADVIRGLGRAAWWIIRAALVVLVAWVCRSELAVAATGFVVFWLVPHRSLARTDR